MSKIPHFVVAAILVTSCSRDASNHELATSEPAYIGSEQCSSCHTAETAQWLGSHHQLAMQVADSQSVLGDFSDQTISYFDTETFFFRRGNGYFVKTQGADGTIQEFEITHTFGVAPLQQYLVATPGGRKQALQFAWDSRKISEGGQRWYHLYANEFIGPDDPLHWTGRYFNWNYMCAECHSTNLQIGYELKSDSFSTTYEEISVGCEACHGPGSRHVDQAKSESFDEDLGLPVGLDDRDGTDWVMNITTGIAERTSANRSQQEPETCGRCHSRRSIVAAEYEYGTALTNTHMPALLEENLYRADGRILQEVYVYGSFVQSRMYAAGVSCSDCHNPHSGELHAGPNPNDTCSTCHLAAKFASTAHSSRQVGDCVSCHMPATTYMGVDDRRDHSFRLPDTATDPEHYGSIIAAGRTGNANDQLLNGIRIDAYPPIARATMLTLLEPITGTEQQSILLQQLDNPDPLVRIGALRALRRQAPELRLRVGSHLLRDPVRSVRVEAALTYIETRDLLPLEDSRAFSVASDEYRDSMFAAAAMPDAALRLAEFETRLGNSAAAARMYEHAIHVGASSAPVQYAYGLYLVRSGNAPKALGHLRSAVGLAPAVPQFAYGYGVALNSLGKPRDALVVLQDAYEQFPDNFDIGWAMATIYRDIGDQESAQTTAARLAERFPSDARVTALEKSLYK